MINTQDMTWILLRGLTREHRHWEQFPQLLQSTFPVATIITPDLPGSGMHHRKRCPLRMQDIMECVRADIAQTERNKPVHILGLSMGAMVAIEWLVRYPHECAGAVLMNTSLHGLNPFYQRMRPRNYWPLIRSLFFNTDMRRREEFIFDLTSNLNTKRDNVVNNWVRYANEYPVSTLNALRQLIAASFYRIPGHAPQQPVLVLNGLKDRLVNPKCSGKLAQHWQLPLQSHPAAGHDLTLDADIWVCERIVEWLQQQ